MQVNGISRPVRSTSSRGLVFDQNKLTYPISTVMRKEDAAAWWLRVYINFMDEIRFERHFRTPYSESYYIMQGNSLQSNNRLGTVDIHFTTTAVHGTLILERELEETDLTKLIEQIDEDLVLSADMPRDDFLVSVYIGKDVGFYSDEYFAEESDNDTAFGEEDES